jgi:hypothetical protein
MTHTARALTLLALVTSLGAAAQDPAPEAEAAEADPLGPCLERLGVEGEVSADIFVGLPGGYRYRIGAREPEVAGWLVQPGSCRSLRLKLQPAGDGVWARAHFVVSPEGAAAPTAQERALLLQWAKQRAPPRGLPGPASARLPALASLLPKVSPSPKLKVVAGRKLKPAWRPGPLAPPEPEWWPAAKGARAPAGGQCPCFDVLDPTLWAKREQASPVGSFVLAQFTTPSQAAILGLATADDTRHLWIGSVRVADGAGAPVLEHEGLLWIVLCDDAGAPVGVLALTPRGERIPLALATPADRPLRVSVPGALCAGEGDAMCFDWKALAKAALAAR